MHRDESSDRACRIIRFWTPVFVFAAVAGGIGLFQYGQLTKEAERSGEDKATLAVTAMRSPSEALEDAERQLMADRIDFPVYRDLVQAALSRRDSEVRNVAYQSIQRVLASGRTSGERLKKWLPSLPTEVFIMTSNKNAAQDIEEKLKRRDTDVVIQEDGKPISKTQVFCYDQDVCKQTAPSLLSVLREEGYEVDQAKLSDGTAASANRIDIQLAEVTVGKPANPGKKTIVAKAPRHPKAASPRLVAQE
jgi:hypothetical protein